MAYLIMHTCLFHTLLLFSLCTDLEFILDRSGRIGDILHKCHSIWRTEAMTTSHANVLASCRDVCVA